MMLRTNWRNTGKGFESAMAATLAAYENAGVMLLRKTDPPMRVFSKGKSREIIFVANPWLDWAGSWTAQSGRLLLIETKSTGESKLPIWQESGGLTRKQIKWMARWEKFGAAVCCVWEWKGRYALLTMDRLRDELQGTRHLDFAELPQIQQGQGFVLCDFEKPLREHYNGRQVAIGAETAQVSRQIACQVKRKKRAKQGL